MKKLGAKLLILPALLGLTFGSGLFLLKQPFLFQSLESKTAEGAPVLNRIRFIPGWNQDTWLMQQSHEGLGKGPDSWDRLAIVVDKTKKPLEARFYQFISGPLQMAEPHQAVPLKARCFACHANGPRSIRADFKAEQTQLNLLDRLSILVLNFHIRSYGRISSRSNPSAPSGGAPFRSQYAPARVPLKLKQCTHCHSPTGARNPLLAEHIVTANFLVKNGFMPPFPYKLKPEDEISLKEAEQP